MMNLTEAEMLELWKLRFNMMPARRDCVVERVDGADIDGKLMIDIRQWYATLLATAPIEWLPVEDVVGDVVAQVSVNGVISVVMPDRCVRPVAWHVKSWATDVTQFHSPDSLVGRQQTVEWLRGCDARPVAVVNGNVLKLYSSSDGIKAAVDKAQCVVRPADGSFQFSEEALSTIPNDTAI